MIDLNHGSHAVYDSPPVLPVGDRINALIDGLERAQRTTTRLTGTAHTHGPLGHR